MTWRPVCGAGTDAPKPSGFSLLGTGVTVVVETLERSMEATVPTLETSIAPSHCQPDAIRSAVERQRGRKKRFVTGV